MNEIELKPDKVQIDPKIKKELKTSVEEEAQVIVHCSVAPAYMQRLRIWTNTYLDPNNKGRKSPLTHAENIAFYPNWTHCDRNEHNFTLFFKALPKTCTSFDLIEDIPEPGGFEVFNIKRNSTDVYHVNI